MVGGARAPDETSPSGAIRWSAADADAPRPISAHSSAKASTTSERRRRSRWALSPYLTRSRSTTATSQEGRSGATPFEVEPATRPQLAGRRPGGSVAGACPDPARWSGCLHMEVLRPTALAEALEARAAHPEALPIAGGTDVMVELNFDKAPAARDPRPDRGAGARRRSSATNGAVRIGAAVPYTRVIDELAGRPARARPGLPHRRLAADPQPRHDRRQPRHRLARRRRPPAAARRRRDGRGRVDAARTRSIADRRVLHRPRPVRPAARRARHRHHGPDGRGPEQFAKIGTRNAMVIAVCSFAVRARPRARPRRHRDRLRGADPAARG